MPLFLPGGASLPLVGDGVTVTASTPLLNLTQTWNNAGVTFNALLVNVTATASAAASTLIDLQVASSSVFKVGKAGDTVLATAATLGWSTDLFLARDAANILAQRNGTTGQKFRIFNTYTDASNYERGGFSWQGNVLYIGNTESAGTGNFRSISLYSKGSIEFASGDTARWNINSSGHVLAAADNTYDIGASGATRPRQIYAGGDIYVGTAGSFVFASSTSLRAPSDGVLLLRNAAASDFSRLQFGGTTSSFPSLKRNAAILEAKLADDSAYAQLVAAGTATNDSAAAGNLGEYLEATLALGSATSLTTATAKTVCSKALTAGDWDVQCTLYFLPAATTSVTVVEAEVSNADNTANFTIGTFNTWTQAASVPGTSSTLSVSSPVVRLSLSASATYYAVARCVFSVSTMTAYGIIRARRVR